MHKKLQAIKSNKRELQAGDRASIGRKVLADQAAGLKALSSVKGRKQTSMAKLADSKSLKQSDIRDMYNPSIGRNSGKSHGWMPSNPNKHIQHIDLYQTKLTTASPNPAAALALDHAIADMIHCKALCFGFAEDPKVRHVLRLAKNVSTSYVPPTRAQVGGPLLTTNYNQLREREDELLLTDAEIYGLQAYGDGATITKTSYCSAFACSPNNPACCLELHDCTPHLESGGTKDAEYIAYIFEEHMDNLDPNGILFDLMMFDGGSNFQKAAAALIARNPRMSVIHGAEHVLALLFSDLAKEPLVKLLKAVYSILYRWFGGAHHATHATFMKHGRLHNKGKKCGMYKPSEARMAGYIHAFLRLLFLKAAFLSMMASPEYVALKVDPRVTKLIKSEVFWRVMFELCKACPSSSSSSANL